VDASIRQQLERFQANPDATAAFEVLEEHFFMTQAWRELAALYRRRAQAPSLAGQPLARAQLLLRLGQVLEERSGDVDAAIDAYHECVRLDPQLRSALCQLRAIYTARCSWEMVLQVAELEAAAPMPGEERARLFSEMGDIWQREMGDVGQAQACYERARVEAAHAGPDEAAAPDGASDQELVQQAWLASARGEAPAAIQALRRALERDPADVAALDMMATVLDGLERYAELADILERRAALATDPETRSAVLARLGALIEEQLGDLGGARSAYERALGADPANVSARVALVRIYRVTEAWNRLRALLESLVSHGAPEEQAGTLGDLGALLEIQFDDAEAACAAYEKALVLDPNDERAQQGLTRLRETQSGDESITNVSTLLGLFDAGADGEARPRGGSAENRAVRVEGVLERKLAGLEARGEGLTPDAVSLRLRIAELRSNKLDDLAGAIAVLEPALASDPALMSVAERLAALYERVGRFADLARLARRAAELVTDVARRVDWYRRAAETARSVGDVVLAVECYEQLLAEQPRESDAKEALIELHRDRGDVESLANALLLEVARATGEREVELHLELAGLLEKALAAPARALLHLRRALELAPERAEALDHALRIADGVGGTFLRLDLLEHLADTAAQDTDRARWLALRGDLLVDALGWREEGRQSWEASLALDPEQAHARQRLDA